MIAGRANALLTGLGVRTNGNSVLKGLLGAQKRMMLHDVLMAALVTIIEI